MTLLDDQRCCCSIDDVCLETELTAFHLACGNGDTACVMELVKHGCDMTLPNKNGETGLQIALAKKHTAVHTTDKLSSVG